ncbi:LysM peptidoglycan-binding domain-containing protein [Anaerotignum sp.]|uniref:LysM peptidoglycan-binding domain-containing protein n=1 Tax=Anaerotignum sp. TaxID=2039241 RepID=UPI0028AC4958|nr:LysM peptidoglycan-binding domain-containing protein [Anaerotignum sp.]
MYRVFLRSVLLPITPQKIQMKINNNNKTMELINGSEINFLRAQGLTEFSFEFLIPHVQYPFAVYPDGFQPPEFYMELLDTLKVEKKPFSFNIFRTMPNGKELFETDMLVSLEEYSVTDDAGEGFDLVASVKLKQFQELKTLEKAVEQQADGVIVVSEKKGRPVSKAAPKTYTVKKGDSLWKICKAQLGDGSKYGEIAKLNGISNPNLIYPGQVIKLGTS